MTDYEKQRLRELDQKADHLLAQQDLHDKQLNQLFARLVYLEAYIQRMMQELDIDPNIMETFQMIKQDARAINLTQLSFQRMN